MGRWHYISDCNCRRGNLGALDRAQSVEGLAVELVIGAVFLALFLPWLYFERKLKREELPVGEPGDQLPPSWRTNRTRREVRRP
jgi:hypothetical protein